MEQVTAGCAKQEIKCKSRVSYIKPVRPWPLCSIWKILQSHHDANFEAPLPTPMSYSQKTQLLRNQPATFYLFEDKAIVIRQTLSKFDKN